MRYEQALEGIRLFYEQAVRRYRERLYRSVLNLSPDVKIKRFMHERIIKGNPYVYVTVAVGRKITSVYVGKRGSPKVLMLERAEEKVKEYAKKLKEEILKDVEEVLRYE